MVVLVGTAHAGVRHYIKQGNKNYRYAQLVENYPRKSDGVPPHRVVANLGRITDPLELNDRA